MISQLTEEVPKKKNWIFGVSGTLLRWSWSRIATIWWYIPKGAGWRTILEVLESCVVPSLESSSLYYTSFNKALKIESDFRWCVASKDPILSALVATIQVLHGIVIASIITSPILRLHCVFNNLILSWRSWSCKVNKCETKFGCWTYQIELLRLLHVHRYRILHRWHYWHLFASGMIWFL